MFRAASPEPVARLTWDQVLAFRTQRQFLEPRTSKGTVEVARRLCGVRAQVASAAAFAIAARQRTPKAGQGDRAIRARSLVKTWGVRGTLHLIAADQAPSVLSSLSGLELRDELKAALASKIASGAVRDTISSGWGELLKPPRGQASCCKARRETAGP